MATPEDRERESRETDTTKFEDALDAEEGARDDLAQDLRDDPSLEPEDDEQ
jgi:hypothetical protein